jgi:hypothetical protein
MFYLLILLYLNLTVSVHDRWTLPVWSGLRGTNWARRRHSDLEGAVADQPGRDFFISYTAVNRPWAEWIAVQLEAAG